MNKWHDDDLFFPKIYYYIISLYYITECPACLLAQPGMRRLENYVQRCTQDCTYVGPCDINHTRIKKTTQKTPKYKLCTRSPVIYRQTNVQRLQWYFHAINSRANQFVKLKYETAKQGGTRWGWGCNVVPVWLLVNK